MASTDDGRSYPLPDDEGARLRDLHDLDVLDTPPEQVYDRLTELAQTLLGIRVAAVSLLDEERQWFKSCQGLVTSGTPREDSICTYAILRRDVMAVEDTRDHPEYRGVTIDGWEIRSYASAPLMSERGHVVGVFCVFDSEPRSFSERDRSVLRLLADETQDLLQKQHRQRQLEELAYTDSVTGVPNRYALEHRLEALNTDDPSPTEPFELFWIGVDRFTRINDALGYRAGDQVLHEMADRFQEVLPPEAFLTRMGGDEFLVLLPVEEDAEMPESRRLVRSLFDSLGEPFTVKDHAFHLSLSVGVTRFSFPAASVDHLLSQANRAMVRAASRRGNSVEYYYEALRFPKFQGLEIENDFHESLYDDRLALHFQPIYEVQSGRMISTEALLRWEHPQRGPISPPEIITIAENTGLILHLEEWIIDHACDQMNRLRAWSDHEDFSVAVNVSASSFMQHQSFVELIEMILNAQQLEGNHLTLEVTESLAMKDLDYSVNVMKELKDLDVKLAIDDFGTGYSSLSHLSRFPVDILKIDRSFVGRIGAGPESDQIIRTVLTLGHELGLTVVAEGVETQEQLDFLAEEGCDRYQGWLKSRALPADELTRGP